MARFNTAAKKSVKATKTVNYEGATAYKLSDKLDLYAAVVTSTLSDKFYEAKDGRVKRVRDLVQKCPPQFVAQLAVYTREQMYLRTMPVVLLTELAKVHNGDNLVARAVARTVQRVDEITELLGCYAQANHRKGTKRLGKLSNQLRRGLAQVFNRFDEYQFAKYNRDTEVKLRDALFLAHPKPKNAEQQGIFDRIANGQLETPYTWETQLSEAGQKGISKKVVWEELIASKKLGYMALLRNLRNILQAEVSKKHIDQVCAFISNTEQVLRSRQFPFRFLSAYRELKALGDGVYFIGDVLQALEQALEASAANIAGFDDSVAVEIATDFSGSMSNPISQRSSILSYEVAGVLALLLRSQCERVLFGVFGDTFERISFSNQSVLANTHELSELAQANNTYSGYGRRSSGKRGCVGHSTNGWLVLDNLVSEKRVVDKVMIFTDCQIWDSWGGGRNTMQGSWSAYKKIAPKAKLYLFDIAGYGTTPVDTRSGDVYLIAGWSDKVFDILSALDRGSNAVAEIEKIDL